VNNSNLEVEQISEVGILDLSVVIIIGITFRWQHFPYKTDKGRLYYKKSKKVIKTIVSIYITQHSEANILTFFLSDLLTFSLTYLLQGAQSF